MCPQCLEEYRKKIDQENKKSARIDSILWVVIIGVGIVICVYCKGFYETFEIALKGVGVFIGAIVFLFLFCLLVRMCINKGL